MILNNEITANNHKVGPVFGLLSQFHNVLAYTPVAQRCSMPSSNQKKNQEKDPKGAAFEYHDAGPAQEELNWTSFSSEPLQNVRKDKCGML